MSATSSPGGTKVLIVGAGVGGLSTALALRRHGIDATVFEQAPELREVGAVAVREEGRRRLYRLNGAALKPIHDWVKGYEQLWSDRFEELDAVLERLE